MQEQKGVSADYFQRLLDEIDLVEDLTEKEKKSVLDVLEALEMRSPKERKMFLDKAAIVAAPYSSFDGLTRVVAAFLRLLARKLQDTVEHVVIRIMEIGSILALLQPA